MWVGIMVMVLIIYLTIWTVLDPLIPYSVPDQTDPELMYLICKNISPAWYIALIIVEGLFIVVATFVAYNTRKLELLLFNESAYIGLCAYNLLFTGCVLFPISLFLVDGQENARFALYSIAIFLNCTVITAVTFIPKIKLSLKSDDEVKMMRKSGQSMNIVKTSSTKKYTKGTSKGSSKGSTKDTSYL